MMDVNEIKLIVSELWKQADSADAEILATPFADDKPLPQRDADECYDGTDWAIDALSEVLGIPVFELEDIENLATFGELYTFTIGKVKERDASLSNTRWRAVKNWLEPGLHILGLTDFAPVRKWLGGTWFRFYVTIPADDNVSMERTYKYSRFFRPDGVIVPARDVEVNHYYPEIWWKGSDLCQNKTI